VSEELGVRYVLEGSFQRSGDRVRVTAQLIDAGTGNHVWGERYERDLKDIFALQDEITIKVLTGVRVKLTGTGGAVPVDQRAVKDYFKGKQGLDCYLKIAEAGSYNVRWNIQDNKIARQIAEEAIAMCPDNPLGYYALGITYSRDYNMANTKSPQETLEKSQELFQKALAMDDSIAQVHSELGTIYALKGDFDRALAEEERAMALGPGDTAVLGNYAAVLTQVGRSEEAVQLCQKAIRLNPFTPSWLYRLFGRALTNAGRYDEAVSAYKKAIELAPDNFMAHINLTVTYILMGREKEARAEAAEVLRINPRFTVDAYAKTAQLQYKDKAQSDRSLNAMRKAGLK